MNVTRDTVKEFTKEDVKDKQFILHFNTPKTKDYQFAVIDDKDIPVYSTDDNSVYCVFGGGFPHPTSTLKVWFKFNMGFSLWDIDELKDAEKETRVPIPVYTSGDFVKVEDDQQKES